MKFIDNGSELTCVLIPGWGMDCRIFSEIPLPYNFLEATVDDPARFCEELLAALQDRGLKTVILFGLSMGAFLALDFAKAHPEKVSGLFLSGLRPAYPSEDIASVEASIIKNASGYMRQFYKLCFYDKGGWLAFRSSGTFDDYIAGLDVDTLVKGLSYLSQFSLDWTGLDLDKVTVFHGRHDIIAPYEEIRLSVPEGVRFYTYPYGHVLPWADLGDEFAELFF